jgi:hypothetical protein
MRTNRTAYISTSGVLLGTGVLVGAAGCSGASVSMAASDVDLTCAHRREKGAPHAMVSDIQEVDYRASQGCECFLLHAMPGLVCSELHSRRARAYLIQALQQR